MKKLIVSLAVLGSTFAFADEVELKPAQEELKAKDDEEMADKLKAMNEKCGTKVTVTTDYQNWVEAEWGRAHGWCANAVDAIADMCSERPAYKKALSKKLKGISCLFAGVKPKDKKDGSNDFTLRNMSFEKGVFVWHLHLDHANISDNVKATIEKALN